MPLKEIEIFPSAGTFDSTKQTWLDYVDYMARLHFISIRDDVKVVGVENMKRVASLCGTRALTKFRAIEHGLWPDKLTRKEAKKMAKFVKRESFKKYKFP